MTKSSSSASSKVDQELIRSIAELLNDANLAEIEIEKDDFRVRVTRSWPIEASTQAYAAPPPPPPSVSSDVNVPENLVKSVPEKATGDPAANDLAANPGTLTSPMVGTAYLAAEPGAAPYVAVGSKVCEGQTVLIVEAMKTMNQIPAHKSGTIARVLVEDKQPVEYGEPLVVID